jgi:hypothetical protein
MAKIASIAVAASVPFVVLAFWPLYLSRPFATIDPFTHLHAAAGSLWLALLIAQPVLIHTRRFTAHRFLGRISYGLAALFAASSLLLSHHRLASMDDATLATDGFAHYLPVYATIIFALAYGFGIRFRHWPAAHGRFMVCTAIPLIDPVFGRVLAFFLPPWAGPWLYQVVTFSVATAIAGLVVFSFRGPAPARRALFVYFAVLVGLEIGWFTLSPTAAWLDLVRGFRSIPLP